MAASPIEDKSSKPKKNSAPPAKPKPESSGGDFDLPRAFGRLTLLRHVARGGMGEVYLAATGGIEGAERPCIVKIIRREYADDKSFLARFFDEARIQAQFQHPGVVQVLEAATDETEKPFVVLEHVEGRNLSEVRHRAQQLKVRVDWADAVAVGITLGDGLAHVHERTDASGKPLEICHRDLSPQNVMVGYAGDVKVIDFGTARGENRRCRTVAGIVFAKPGYVAPEVANETPGGPPADLYAFGIMIWELIAGRRFLSGEASAHMAAVGKGSRHPTPLAGLTDAPPELDAIIGKLTATRVEDRYASARDAAKDLASVLSHAPSLANGERSVRARIAHLMQRLYPSEPARSRGEFARLVAKARKLEPKPLLAVASPTPAPANPGEEGTLPGTRYRIVRQIAQGEMGVVYEAFHVDLGRTVALKVLPVESAVSDEAAERFRTEARAIAKLRHEGIVELHDFGVSGNGQPYYAMELLKGETLERYLDREKGTDWREAVELGIQACRALATAHEAGVVHRDIKPANLFLTSDGSLKVLDFGVAKSAAIDEAPGDEKNGLALLGTPEYMAPEQITGEAVDARSDVYALGAVLYELVTGRLPHVGHSTVELLDVKLHKDPERPRLRAPQRGLPPCLDEAIVRALHREPALRFQNVDEMRAALEEARREPVRRRARRRAVALTAMATLGAIIGTVVATASVGDEVRARAAAVVEPARSTLSALRPASSELVLAVIELPDVDEPVFELERAPAPAVNPALAASNAEQPPPVVEADVEAGMEPDAEPKRAEAPADVGKPDAPAAEAEAAEEQPPSSEPAIAKNDPEEQLAAVEAELERARALMAKNVIAGYDFFRRIAKKHPEHARALEAWSKSAIATKAWGDALRAARQWAKVDESPQAQVHLARMQRTVGRTSEARATLRRVVADHPDNVEAVALLEHLGSRRVALKD